MHMRGLRALIFAAVAVCPAAAFAEPYLVGNGPSSTEEYRLERLILPGTLKMLVYLDRDRVDIDRVVSVAALTPDGEAALRYLELESQYTRALFAKALSSQEQKRARRIEQNSRLSGRLSSYAECAFWLDLPCGERFFPADPPKLSVDQAKTVYVAADADLGKVQEALIGSDVLVQRARDLQRTVKGTPYCSSPRKGHPFGECDPLPKYFAVRLGIDYTVAY